MCYCMCLIYFSWPINRFRCLAAEKQVLKHERCIFSLLAHSLSLRVVEVGWLSSSLCTLSFLPFLTLSLLCSFLPSLFLLLSLVSFFLLLSPLHLSCSHCLSFPFLQTFFSFCILPSSLCFSLFTVSPFLLLSSFLAFLHLVQHLFISLCVFFLSSYTVSELPALVPFSSFHSLSFCLLKFSSPILGDFKKERH